MLSRIVVCHHLRIGGQGCDQLGRCGSRAEDGETDGLSFRVKDSVKNELDWFGGWSGANEVDSVGKKMIYHMHCAKSFEEGSIRQGGGRGGWEEPYKLSELDS